MFTESADWKGYWLQLYKAWSGSVISESNCFKKKCAFLALAPGKSWNPLKTRADNEMMLSNFLVEMGTAVLIFLFLKGYIKINNSPIKILMPSNYGCIYSTTAAFHSLWMNGKQWSNTSLITDKHQEIQWFKVSICWFE